jgi:hypothetical protein
MRHVARDATILDGYARLLMIERLSLPDVVLAKPGPDATLLHTEIAALRAELDELAAQTGRREITARQLAIASGPLQKQLEAAEDRLAATVRPTVLGPFAATHDPAAVWDGLPLDRRRAVVAELVQAIIVHPAPRGRPAGWRPGERYFRADTVDVEWQAP